MLLQVKHLLKIYICAVLSILWVLDLGPVVRKLPRWWLEINIDLWDANVYDEIPNEQGIFPFCILKDEKQI